MTSSTAHDLGERRRSAESDQGKGGKKRKYFDPKISRVSVRVLPGEHYVAEAPDEVLVTILGSCVAACVRDPKSGLGGMNHFMLPHNGAITWGQAGDASRYGNHAMERLIGTLIRRGADRRTLEIKVFGGANVTKGSVHLIGDQNCEFIRRYLRDEGLVCEVYDLGGDRARRVQYFPDSGRAKRLLLRRAGDQRMIEDETAYYRRISDVAARGQTGAPDRGGRR